MMSSKERISSLILGAGLALSVAAFAPAAFAENYNVNGIDNSAKTSGTASLGNGGNHNPGIASGGDSPRDVGMREDSTPDDGAIVHGVPANNPGTNTAPTTAGGSTGLGAYGTGGRGSGSGAVSGGHEVGYGTAGEAQKFGPNPKLNLSRQSLGRDEMNHSRQSLKTGAKRYSRQYSEQ
jgi:hypothetical protein